MDRRKVSCPLFVALEVSIEQTCEMSAKQEVQETTTITGSADSFTHMIGLTKHSNSYQKRDVDVVSLQRV